MRYLIVFNIFCLAVFIQMACNAPLVDENEQVVEAPVRRGWNFLKGLIRPAEAR